MPQEIERKFLVTGEYKPQAYAHSRIVQGYISSVRGRTVRVRIRDERGFLTIKVHPMNREPAATSGKRKFRCAKRGNC